jgi:pyruvate kinase
MAQQHAARVAALAPGQRAGAVNLLHYLALRRHDLRPLQLRLSRLGLSSLGRAEAHVLATVDAVLRLLHQAAGLPPPALTDEAGVLSHEQGSQGLQKHTEDLLGKAPARRDVRIMVTMPGTAAHDPVLVRALLAQGMDIMRINCAHDGEAEWGGMLGHLAAARTAVDAPCRVLMDLGGPKLRTGVLEPGPAVVRLRPRRDAYGHVLAPARVWLTHAAQSAPPPAPAQAVLPVDSLWLARLMTGDHVDLVDTRGRERSLQVADARTEGAWLLSERSVYVAPGTVLHHRTAAPGMLEAPATRVGDLPAREQPLLLQPGDLLHLTADPVPGRNAVRDSAGELLTPAQIACQTPEVLAQVRPGERIKFDDGKIGGLVEEVQPDGLLVRIAYTPPGGGKLRAERGINLPDSALDLPALTAQDRADLPFVARHADMVALSFASRAADVTALLDELGRLGGRLPGVVLKIETRRGFDHLPELLLAAMRAPRCGVMIARGDLAVECGYERLAEVQEEILWICEAAHVPVIWATQVLENLAKTGSPSRAEITDAAMGHRAECVMLNKGPHILRAVELLDGILARMQAHQNKKSARLRPLSLARQFS